MIISKSNFLINYLISLINNNLVSLSIGEDNIYRLEVKSDALFLVMQILKFDSNLRYNNLTDISCVDNLGDINRFQLNYILLSLDFNSRIIISINIKQNSLISSIISLYNGSNWMEREVWDMFGIYFSNHKDLRRILTDYGFDGHPFRKDFPLNGYFEIRYNEYSQSIVYENIELTQGMRIYSLINPLIKKNYYG